MKPEQASRIITEKMGGCWHEWVNDWKLTDDAPLPVAFCSRCGDKKYGHIDNNIDYTTPDGFFKAWQWAQSKEWWDEFVCWTTFPVNWESIFPYSKKWPVIPTRCIDSTTFAITLAEWLEKRYNKRPYELEEDARFEPT
jgi:hypothetical protein